MNAALRRAVVATASVLCLSAVAHARPPEGGYFGFGVGYGIVSGERGVALKPSSTHTLSISPSNPLYDEVVRTEFGEGLSLELRFGWLIGPVAPEIVIFGHGSFDFENGAGYPMLQVRFHPLMLVDSMADTPVDAACTSAPATRSAATTTRATTTARAGRASS